MSRLIKVNDKMQTDYSYKLHALSGRSFDSQFTPGLTPKQMLELGVFGGKYMNDCKEEFPQSWFKNAKLSLEKDPALNYFKVDASQPLSKWKSNGWITPEDPRGWFQWYCRYYLGRRIDSLDKWQISRWRAFSRHMKAVVKNCAPRDLECRKRQRQALLHWAYDSRRF